MNDAVRSPPARHFARSECRFMVAAGLLPLALIAIVYRRVRQAGFVWDDLTAFVENSAAGTNSSRGNWLSPQAQHEDAAALLRRSIAITPEEPLAHYLLAESFAMTGDWPSAAADTALAIARDDQRAALPPVASPAGTT